MKPLGDATLRGPANLGARKLARRLLRQARNAAPRIKDESDETAVHDFRVAVRRLRSGLRAYRAELPEKRVGKPRRALSRMARATGSTRDYEVKIRWLQYFRRKLTPARRADADWLLERLSRRREDSAATMLGGVPEEFARIADELDKALEPKPRARRRRGRAVTFGQATGELVLSHCDELRRHVKLVRGPRDIEEAHQARIQLKRLRYLLEPVSDIFAEGGSVIERLKHAQILLGDFNDMAVLCGELLRAAEHDALSHVEEIWRDAVTTGATAGALRDASRAARPRLGIFALAQLVRRHADSLFHDMDVGGDLLRLIKDVETLGRQLIDSYTAEHEIERKYLLRALPRAVRDKEVIEIEQGYLPGKRHPARLRRERQNGRERFVRTVKTGQGLERVQFEEKTTKKAFWADWPATEGRRVIKRRYLVPNGDLTWEIDEFTDRELVLAEVELSAPDTAVTLPRWLRPYVIREVTDESHYSNVHLAR